MDSSMRDKNLEVFWSQTEQALLVVLVKPAKEFKNKKDKMLCLLIHFLITNLSLSSGPVPVPWCMGVSQYISFLPSAYCWGMLGYAGLKWECFKKTESGLSLKWEQWGQILMLKYLL
jgi:hypothetical protein